MTMAGMDGGTAVQKNVRRGDAARGPMPRNSLLYGAIAVAIVIVVVAVLLLSSHSSTGLVSVLPPGKTVSLKQLGSLVLQHLNSTSQLNVSYSAVALLTLEGSAGGSGGSGVTMTVPFEVSLLKYRNSSRLSISAVGVPIVGNFSLVAIRNNSRSSYVCTKSALSSFLNSSAPATYTCSRSNASVTSSLLNSSSSFGVSSAASSLNSITLKAVGLRSYKGEQCVLVSGEGNATVNGTAGAAAHRIGYNITSCLSNIYYVPLNFSMSTSTTNTLFGSYSLKLSMNETSLGTSVTDAEVVSLPGPVQNSTYVGTGGAFPGYTTVNYTYTTINYTTVNYTYPVTTIAPSGSSLNGTSCGSFNLSTALEGARLYGTCTWGGGPISIYAAGGNSGYVSYTISGGPNNVTYAHNSTTARCSTPMGSVYLPAQTYRIKMATGVGGGDCGNATLQLSG